MTGNPPMQHIDKTWTLFLDRDGVINIEKPGDYIYHYEEFSFYPHVPQALHLLARRFHRILIITNQRGIGRGLMSKEALEEIHTKMLSDIVSLNGRIDGIYYCDAVDDSHPDRKPNVGMGLQAKKDYPDIDFSKSIMVGNTLGDMQFGRNLGMYTVYIQTTNPGQVFPHPLIDYSYKDLLAFAQAID